MSQETKPYLQGPSIVRARNVDTSSPVKKQPSSPSLPPASLSDPWQLRQSPKEIERPPKPIDLTNPERYPTPPPKNNLEGPAAVYPYIPVDVYSCRPGGPRLYDILNDLSLDDFGITSWSVIEREEEIFELPDVRDEDKVMHALWGRYIMLNRYDNWLSLDATETIFSIETTLCATMLPASKISSISIGKSSTGQPVTLPFASC